MLIKINDVIAVPRPSSDGSILRYSVGRIQEISDCGVRITLYSRITSQFNSWDKIVTWEGLNGVLVCTAEHDLSLFLDEIKEGFLSLSL
tara:strand:+ start:478 stop:744 length:267 start_codon:yes stop_codon:yes gene_type:complete